MIQGHSIVPASEDNQVNCQQKTQIVDADCNSVEIIGGALKVTVVGEDPVNITPTLSRATGAGLVTIPAGKKSVSIYNAGMANAQVLGAVFKPGEQITFSGNEGELLTAISYNPLTSELLVGIIT